MADPGPRRVGRLIAGLATALALALWLSGCEFPSWELRMHVPESLVFRPDKLQSVFEEQSRLRVSASTADRNLSAVEAITSGQADLGLVENSTAFIPGIRAVIPVFESVLHVQMRRDYAPLDLQRPLQGAVFHVRDQSPVGRSIVELVTRRQGLAEGDYTIAPELVPGVTDIILYFGPIAPLHTGWYVAGYEMVSLGSRLNPQSRFFEEGIGYNAPNMKPRVIPALTYDLPGNEEPLLTVSVDTLLVTGKDAHIAAIYELTRTFIEQKPRFTAVAPQLFGGINESFDPLQLSFPLHTGARRYLNRDEPGLLERYAETINMLVYVTFLLISALLGFARWRAHRKKDRIDTFYLRALDIRDRAQAEDPRALLDELEALEREAFNSLMREKLAANESFRIFTDLLERERRALALQLERNRAGPGR